MKATIPYIKERFRYFNELIFGGRLPDIPIVMTDAVTFLGLCESRLTKMADGKVMHTDFRIKINRRLDRPVTEIDDTLIHEMIHYFINYNELPDTSAHGPIFKVLMNSINAAYGRNLSVSFHSSAEQREQLVSSKPKWHIICLMTLKSGETGLKVLPRTVRTVLQYHRAVTVNPAIAEVSYYLHDNPFFNRYPCSGTLKFHIVDSGQLTENLQGAKLLSVTESGIKVG